MAIPCYEKTGNSYTVDEACSNDNIAIGCILLTGAGLISGGPLAVAAFLTCPVSYGGGCALREELRGVVPCDNPTLDEYQLKDSCKHFQNDDSRLNMMTLPDKLYAPSC